MSSTASSSTTTFFSAPYLFDYVPTHIPVRKRGRSYYNVYRDKELHQMDLESRFLLEFDTETAPRVIRAGNVLAKMLSKSRRRDDISIIATIRSLRRVGEENAALAWLSAAFQEVCIEAEMERSVGGDILGFDEDGSYFVSRDNRKQWRDAISNALVLAESVPFARAFPFISAGVPLSAITSCIEEPVDADLMGELYRNRHDALSAVLTSV